MRLSGSGPGRYTYVGCYYEPACAPPNARGLSDMKVDNSAGRYDMSVDLCHDMTVSNGLRFFATQFYMECFAANDLTHAISFGQATCNTNCYGNLGQICGGGCAQSVYYGRCLEDCMCTMHCHITCHSSRPMKV